MKIKLILLLSLILSACGGSDAPQSGKRTSIIESKIILGSGVKVTSAPHQTHLYDEESFEFNNYSITPLASIDFEAKVLSKKRYSDDKESQLSPVDLALGWQQMSDEKNLAQISISQSNRWYYWHVDNFPISRNEIESQSANMHMIPADSAIKDKLNKIKEGEIISLSGYLVRVDDMNWSWKSSLSRFDTGEGACEVIYITDLFLANTN